MPYAILFPGQGSQFVGMGADLFDARPDLLIDRADTVLGWSLRDMCLHGPEDELTRTEHAQPALFALAVALWQELSPRLSAAPAAAAGHSLGEYSALVAAGVLDFDIALAVVAERGRAMQSAADIEPSGMAALLGADVELAQSVCDARVAGGGRLSVANINAPGQVVVAGGADDLDWLEANGLDLGVRRAVRLKVAGAFHSEFMAPASARVAAALAGVTALDPSFPVYGNVTACPLDTADITTNLAMQVVSPVRFAESLEAMAAAGIDTFLHVGPGDVTAGMAKRTVDGARTVTVSQLADVDAAVEALDG
ncbi:MAG: ACP S-malonyltransferase [Acidimicrobiia bacterium]